MKNRRIESRYRLDFIKENTFSRIWSVRMSRTRVWLVSLGCISALAALIFVILCFTPMRHLLPGSLSGDLRSRYQATTLRVDSIEYRERINSQYLDNVVRILRGEETDTTAQEPASVVIAVQADSLPAAGEAERAFVRTYDERNRFNLSVLAPIAAEGMVFNPPITGSAGMTAMTGGGLALTPHRAIPVTAIYRGTVTGVYFSPEGTSTVVLQHSADFVSVYGGVGDVFVERGQRVEAGQRLAHTSTRNAFVFELWHDGTALDPREYLAF